jgi:hypothetical protein
MKEGSIDAWLEEVREQQLGFRGRHSDYRQELDGIVKGR